MSNPEHLTDLRSAYDAVAETYSTALPDTGFEAPLDMAMIDEFARHIRATNNRAVIDVGCGPGRMSRYLSDAGLTVTGVDLSPQMVRVARKTHPGLAFHVGELTELPAADAAVDGIVAWYSIIHSPGATLPVIAREFRRVLRPGGLALMAFHAGRGHRTTDRAYGHDVGLRIELHSPDEVADRFAEQGFTVRAQLVRAPRATERDPQAAILVARPSARPEKSAQSAGNVSRLAP